MASPRQKQKRIKKRKSITCGRARKRLIRANGSTPKFPIHPDKPGKTVDVAALKLAAEK